MQIRRFTDSALILCCWGLLGLLIFFCSTIAVKANWINGAIAEAKPSNVWGIAKNIQVLERPSNNQRPILPIDRYEVCGAQLQDSAHGFSRSNPYVNGFDLTIVGLSGFGVFKVLRLVRVHTNFNNAARGFAVVHQVTNDPYAFQFIRWGNLPITWKIFYRAKYPSTLAVYEGVGTLLGGVGGIPGNIGLTVSSSGLRANGKEHYNGHTGIDYSRKGDDLVWCEPNTYFRKPRADDRYHATILSAVLGLIGATLACCGASYFTPRWCGEQLVTKKGLLVGSIVIFFLGWFLMWAALCLCVGMPIL